MNDNKKDILEFEEHQIRSVIKLMGLDLPSRQELKVDYKSYLIPLLYFKHEFSEPQVANIFNMDHSTINYHKKRRQRLDDNQDKKFLGNILPLSSSFPYTFPRIEDYDNGSRSSRSTVTLTLGKVRRKKLDAHIKKFGLASPQSALRNLIDKHL